MSGVLPPPRGTGPTNEPRMPGQWPAMTFPPSSRQQKIWPVTALAAVAVVLAAVALVMALKRPVDTRPSQVAAAPPTFSVGESSSAAKQLCDTYNLAARAVGVDTNGNNPALARIALTNAAAMIDSVDGSPALAANFRDAARNLAVAYRTLTAKSSSDAFSEAEYRAALDDVSAKNSAMKKICQA